MQRIKFALYAVLTGAAIACLWSLLFLLDLGKLTLPLYIVVILAAVLIERLVLARL